jgi:lambda family phage portal protein
MAKSGIARTIGRGKAPIEPRAFDAGKAGRRLRSIPTAKAEINAQIRQYGANVLARSRYLARNNPYAAAAKETFVSALVGSGIKPSWLTTDRPLREALQLAFLDWSDETDADGLTDFYGQQAMIAAEMFEAGECFVRLRSRRPEDGLTVPLQLQILPSEMLPLNHNEELSGGRRIECGIEFDAIGGRVAYHFLRRHPGSDQQSFAASSTETVRVPANEILHLFKPFEAGQIRGLPHTVSAITKLAVMDAYDDAELERKRTAALFGGFVTRPSPEDDGHPLGDEELGFESSTSAMEPGGMVDLLPGEDIKFADPADVGGSYEAFQYRNLLAIATGFGVPYAAMTGDLRQTSYGSIRAGLVEFRRRIEAMQHHVLVFQFCRPVLRRWLDDAALAGVVPLTLDGYLGRQSEIRRIKWITPRWEWIDPYKDRQAEKLAVDMGSKSLSDVIEAEGYDPEEMFARIKADRDRQAELGLTFGETATAQPFLAPEGDDE